VGEEAEGGRGARVVEKRSQTVCSLPSLTHTLSHTPSLPPSHTHTPPRYRALAESCLSRDPSQRPSFGRVLQALSREQEAEAARNLPFAAAEIDDCVTAQEL
jgi:hypothetical protein